MGSIERVMIEKRSGQVAYAVLSFGGFLGIGSDYYPIPWDALKYDTSLGGYRTNITEEQLKGAPKYSGRELGLGRFRASPQGLRLLQHAVDRTLILAGGPVAHQGGRPCLTAYTPLRHHISGIFAESISAPVTAGNVAGNVPS